MACAVDCFLSLGEENRAWIMQEYCLVDNDASLGAGVSLCSADDKNYHSHRGQNVKLHREKDAVV